MNQLKFGFADTVITPVHPEYVYIDGYGSRSKPADGVRDELHAKVCAIVNGEKTFLLFSLDKGKDYAEKYLDTFVSLAYVSKKVVYGWVPIVAASQLVKRKPEERDFLLSFASVFEYE